MTNKFCSNVCANLVLRRGCWSGSAGGAVGARGAVGAELTESEYREEVASWIRIGEFDRGLLSHLSTPDILRAFLVFRLCSFDIFVHRSFQMFHLSQQCGRLGEWVLRKTFFDQFVGGDTVPRMSGVVESMQKRGLTLMVLPVLEEDVQDPQSSKKTYDDNLESLLEIASMTASLEKRKKGLLQLKMSAIMPAATLDEASRAIGLRGDCTEGPSATLISEMAEGTESGRGPNLTLSSHHLLHFIHGLQRADRLVKKGKELGLNVVVDAELYSCKPAISAIALALMMRHNGQGPVVGNTIQGYLKDAYPTIRRELKMMTEEVGVAWFGKLVRGAYVDREREVAKQKGVPSPVCDTFADTSLSYNRSIEHVIEQMASQSGLNRSHLVVATHNERSIRLAAQTMKQFDIAPKNESVSFAQIYGMADYLSTPLVKEGYEVYKSTPYGPMGRVMPYLARRASENRGIMNGAREERSMLWKELKARISPSST